jgi:type I restriction enzyme, R subunit
MFEATPAQSEYVTRKKLIDQKLKDAGWSVVAFDLSKPRQAFDWCAIEEFPTESGPADYALCVGGEILGVVEGKRLFSPLP